MFACNGYVKYIKYLSGNHRRCNYRAIISWWIYNRQKKTSNKQDEVLCHIQDLEENNELVLKKIEHFEESHDKLLQKLLELDKRIDEVVEKIMIEKGKDK